MNALSVRLKSVCAPQITCQSALIDNHIAANDTTAIRQPNTRSKLAPKPTKTPFSSDSSGKSCGTNRFEASLVAKRGLTRATSRYWWTLLEDYRIWPSSSDATHYMIRAGRVASLTWSNSGETLGPGASRIAALACVRPLTRRFRVTRAASARTVAAGLLTVRVRASCAVLWREAAAGHPGARAASLGSISERLSARDSVWFSVSRSLSLTGPRLRPFSQRAAG